MKIAITGSTGLIGSRIVELLQDEFQFIPLASGTFDITNREQVSQELQNLEYDLLLHLASYTNVDKAETERDLAYKLNVQGTKNIFEITEHRGKKFMYISSDFVFGGHHPPYYENSGPNPISVYGKTKYEGEQVVKNKAMIIRTAYPYRQMFDKKRDFVRSIRATLHEGKQLRMVQDSLITPTFIDDLAMGIKYLINNFSPEIYHVVGSRSISPFEAGKLIAQKFQLDETLILPINYAEYYQDKAKRPQYSEIKTQKDLPKMCSFEDGLKMLL